MFTVPAVVRFERVVIFCVVLTLNVPFVPPTCAPEVPLKESPVPAPMEEVAAEYVSPLFPAIKPPKVLIEIGLENLFKTPLKVLLSPKRVEDAAVPAATLMVIGDAPRTANGEHDALPVQVTLVVAVEVSVLPFTTYAS